jgi:hypothetical protein
MSRIIETVVETYRRMPSVWAFAVAAVASLSGAAIAGLAGGFAAMYLYDRGKSKGDDLAVFASGLLAAGTFAFVMLFTWLRTLHHKTSLRTPWFAWFFCLAGSLLITFVLWPTGYLDYYMIFICAGWIAILLLGLAAVVLSRRWFIDELE